MRFKFGADPEYKYHVDISAKNIETAVKIFKVKELWPEQYIKSDTRKRLERGYNDAEVYVPVEIPEDAYIPVYIYDEEKEDKILEDLRKKKRGKQKRWWEREPDYRLPFFESINVDYNKILDTKYLPLQETGEESKELTENREMAKASSGKIAAREWENRMGKMKKELEEKKRNLENEIERFREILHGKVKILYAIETYLGVYEEIVQITDGKAASPEEPVTVYQQKCYMDEETGLTELDGYEFAEGLDFRNMEEFDNWIKTRYKRYLYKPKSIMAWQVRRTEKDYGSVWDNTANVYNFETYFLLRNGDKAYRIFSDVATPDTMFPTEGKVKEIFKEDKEWNNDGKKIKKFYEKYMYIFVMLQGLIDRTDVFGTNFAGKIDFINPLRFDKNYIQLVRDAEPENWISDGRPAWDEYKEMNEDTITAGSRVLVNHTWSEYRENPKADINGEVFIVEEYKENKSKEKYRYILKIMPSVLEVIRKYYLNGAKVTKEAGKAFENELKKIDRELTVDRWGDIICRGIRITNDTERSGVVFDVTRAEEVFAENVKRMENNLKSHSGDEYKIYYRNYDTVYNGWADYYGHERKNRIGYWAAPGEIINVDTVTMEEIRYYLNNRLYRKQYLKLIGFMKRVYMFKKREYAEETPFVKLVMGKTGCSDEKKVRELLTWWKIKNKWKRSLNIDDAKAYRMICRKLVNTGGLI
jgi:hypothetical protein